MRDAVGVDRVVHLTVQSVLYDVRVGRDHTPAPEPPPSPGTRPRARRTPPRCRQSLGFLESDCLGVNDLVRRVEHVGIRPGPDHGGSYVNSRADMDHGLE